VAHFADTNIAVYAFQTGPKAERALAVLAGAVLSVQVLNEFANVCIRKLGYDRQTLEMLISELRSQAAAIESITETTHDLAREIAFRYELSFYDSALIAAALLADCDTIYSEDMQHGLVIEGRLTIENPFR
jgi:predicted nucleic acid-binding protein